MKKLVVLTGSGISAESGLKTFRESNGLWEEYDVMEVASYEGWLRNKELVLKFYNDRRAQLLNAVPNAGHTGLAELEDKFDVQVITQNVDNLHERAGSKNVLHLHGMLTEARCTEEPDLIMDIGYKALNLGDTCPNGHQLRPNIVWFGELVPAIGDAARIVQSADILVVIGTSMVVYPAAGLVHYALPGIPVYLIDPGDVDVPRFLNVRHIQKKAGDGVPELKTLLLTP